MGTAFPLLSYGENAWERCCIVTKLPNTVTLGHKHITIYFLKCIFCCPKRCFLDHKIWQNALAAGAPPRTPLGELTTLLQTRLGRGHPDPTPFSAFDASILAPSTLDTRLLSAPRISRLRRSILAFPLLLIYEMTTGLYCQK